MLLGGVVYVVRRCGLQILTRICIFDLGYMIRDRSLQNNY